MAGAKETPRQKMIGMMYLVLTAMLALNVTRDIMNAFITVDQSLVVTKDNFEKKIESLYSDFDKALAEDEKKVKEFHDKAMLVKNYTNEVVTLINDIRTELVMEVDGVEKNVADTMMAKDLNAADNYDIPTHLLCGSDEAKGHNGKAHEIHLKVDEYKEKILNLFENESVRNSLKLGLDMNDSYNPVTKQKETWEIRHFYHNVAAAAIALLNKTILEVKNAEAEALNALLKEISARDFKFDKIEAKVVPKSKYVLSGSPYEADIFVAAYSTTQNPEVLIGKYDTTTGKFLGEPEKIQGSAGKVKYVVNASGLGPQEYQGVINIQAPDGTVKPYHFKSDYVVGKPAATISADKMNVFYRGLQNPVSISAPGVAAGQEKVSITGANFKKTGPGKYIIEPTESNKVTITVSAELNGKVTRMGAQEFRVKNVPTPTPKVAGKSSGAVGKALLKAAPFVSADLEDFLFDGVSFKVVSFTFSTTVNGLIKEEQCRGNKLNDGALSLVNTAKRGQKVYFENIKAVGPDGKTKTISSVILKLD